MKLGAARDFLENLYATFNRKEYIATDPIVFPHTFGGNVEFVAFVSSMFAYGNVRAMRAFLEKLFLAYGTDPYKIDAVKYDDLYYRFQSSADICTFMECVKEIYLEWGSVENYMISLGSSLEESKVIFSNNLRRRCNDTRGIKNLFADPLKSGAKRLNMFLRWMIRDDEVDFGLWKGYDASSLIMPVDTHILRFSFSMGIISDVSSTRKNAVGVTSFFKDIEPVDPVKYDFSLTRLGIVHHCEFVRGDKCNGCTIDDKCGII